MSINPSDNWDGICRRYWGRNPTNYIQPSPDNPGSVRAVTREQVGDRSNQIIGTYVGRVEANEGDMIRVDIIGNDPVFLQNNDEFSIRMRGSAHTDNQAYHLQVEPDNFDATWTLNMSEDALRSCRGPTRQATYTSSGSGSTVLNLGRLYERIRRERENEVEARHLIDEHFQVTISDSVPEGEIFIYDPRAANPLVDENTQRWERLKQAVEDHKKKYTQEKLDKLKTNI